MEMVRRRRRGTCTSLRMVTAAHPKECVRQRLLEHFGITVPRCTTEYETAVIALGFEGRGRALIGHHPVVIGFFRIFGAEVVLGYVREDAQRSSVRCDSSASSWRSTLLRPPLAACGSKSKTLTAGQFLVSLWTIATRSSAIRLHASSYGTEKAPPARGPESLFDRGS